MENRFRVEIRFRGFGEKKTNGGKSSGPSGRFGQKLYILCETIGNDRLKISHFL